LDQIREESEKLEITIVNLKNENAKLIGYYLTSTQKKDCCSQLVYMESVLRAGILRDPIFGPSTQPAVPLTVTQADLSARTTFEPAAPSLSQEQKILLEKFENLNPMQKEHLLDNFPEGELLPEQRQDSYISEICTSPHFELVHVNPSEKLRKLPYPSDIISWSDVTNFARPDTPVTVFVVGMASKNNDEARVAKLIVNKITLTNSKYEPTEVMGVNMFNGKELCLKLTNNRPVKSWCWTAYFPNVKKTYQLGGFNEIDVYFDKEQTNNLFAGPPQPVVSSADPFKRSTNPPIIPRTEFPKLCGTKPSSLNSDNVGCYVIREHEHKIQILVHLRGVPPLKISGPGGKRDDNDNDQQTLEKEMSEETTGGTLCSLNWILFQEQYSHTQWYSFYVAKYEETKCLILGPDANPINQQEVAEWEKFMDQPEIGNSRHAWINLKDAVERGIKDFNPRFYNGMQKLSELSVNGNLQTIVFGA
jgi:8-oxo-dGTP pyrophosphatase MutT (NUDIX family)